MLYSRSIEYQCSIDETVVIIDGAVNFLLMSPVPYILNKGVVILLTGSCSFLGHIGRILIVVALLVEHYHLVLIMFQQ